MVPVEEYCKVTKEGIAHLFCGFDYGRVCVCGRKVFGFSVEDEEPTLRDVRPETSSRLLSAAYARHCLVVTAETLRANQLLARGEAEIRRARCLREEGVERRRRRSLVRTEAVITRGERVIRSARRLRADAASVRARRAARCHAGGVSSPALGRSVLSSASCQISKQR